MLFLHIGKDSIYISNPVFRSAASVTGRQFPGDIHLPGVDVKKAAKKIRRPDKFMQRPLYSLTQRTVASVRRATGAAAGAVMVLPIVTAYACASPLPSQAMPSAAQ